MARANPKKNRNPPGANRHGPWFGDERAQNRTDGQDPDPPCGRRAAADSGDTSQGRLGESDDRPRRGEGHDHYDEQRFSVGDGLADVVSGHLPPEVHRGCDEQDPGPQAEYHLDFSQEVENLRAHTRRHRSAGCAALCIVTLLHPVCETSNACCRKRVENRQDEHTRGNGVEGLDLNAHGEIGRKRLIGGGRVTLQRARKFGCGGRFPSHYGALALERASGKPVCVMICQGAHRIADGLWQHLEPWPQQAGRTIH